MAVSLLVIVIALSILALLVTGAYLIIRDTQRKSGRWGINLTATVCGQCRAPMPVMRKPASIHQALWGGWTCAECGLELDKWGKPIESQPFPAKWSAQLQDPPAPPAKPVDERYKPSADEMQRGDYRA